ncbi:vitamin K epoxide reductase family protein [uncultured Amnibacterium sp.]|uniref:vitamin K epoxide reductase family protein n=1 Tax=uncultured Amnibacterium sp. TaxID=1631851 RepID=UPI0035CA5FD8
MSTQTRPGAGTPPARTADRVAAPPSPAAREALAPPVALAVLLIVGGVLGLIGAFELTIDKFALLQHPSIHLNCNINPLVTCSKNLNSPEGAVFGFPNSVIGLMCFPAPILLGVAGLAGTRFPRWFWAAFNVGMAFAIGFVMFLITQSLFHLGTLCPWCMVVWIGTIPMVIATTLFNLSTGALPLGRNGRRVGASLLGWTPLITLVVYLTVAVLAQVKLDVLHTVF